MLYRALDERYREQIRLEMIDPRNLIIYTVIMIQQGWRAKKGLFQTIHNWFKGYSTKAIIIDGEVFSFGEIPNQNDLFQFLDQKIQISKSGLEVHHGLEG